MVSEEFIEMKYPISIQWIFTDKSIRNARGEILKSTHFRLPGFPVTYYLSLKMEQIDDSNPDMSVKVHCYSDYYDIEIEADFRLAVKLYSDKRLDKIKVRGTKCKFNKEMSEIECFYVKSWQWWDKSGEFIFQLFGTLIITNLHSIPLSINVPKIYKLMLTDDNGKDFTIVAEGQELKVHKSILQQVSPVFTRMFESQWKESNEGKIEFKFIPFKLAKIAINLFYGKTFWGFLDKNEYIQIYQFADQYDIIALKNAVKNSIILTPQNIVEYSNLVVEMKSYDLIVQCMDYLILCSQYSLQIRNIESLTDSVKTEIADRMLSSSLLKRNVEDENISRISEHSYEKKIESIDPFAPQPAVIQEPPLSAIFSSTNFVPGFIELLQNLPNQTQHQEQQNLLILQQQFMLWQQQQQQLQMFVNTVISNEPK